jgi:single-strand DNA-binding protein
VFTLPYRWEDVSYSERRRNDVLNKIMLIGNLGRDPEMNVTADGTPFVRFSLAINRRTKHAQGERSEETEWFNVVAWRSLAETCNTYLQKGSKVYLEGRLTQRKYTDKNGVERTMVEVVASDVEFLSSKQQGAAGAELAAEADEFP